MKNLNNEWKRQVPRKRISSKKEAGREYYNKIKKPELQIGDTSN